MSRILCFFGLHRFVPIKWLTCNPADLGHICSRCYRERHYKVRHSDRKGSEG